MTMRQLWSRSVPGYVLISRSGIRYSNIVALQETSVGTPSTLTTSRPRWNQWLCGTSPLAMAKKLARRDSEARRS